MENKSGAGHLAALVTIVIWGTTYISTKILLVDFEPIEILLFRFIIGLLALFLIYPRPLRGTTFKQELTFVAAGLCGICLYYLLENIALTYTMASNVGVVGAVAPFFVAIASRIFLKGEEPLRIHFFLGFVVAMAGICLISFSGSKLQLNPLGDLLAVAACMVWAFYSVFTRKIGQFGYHTILTTRRMFCYGILFMIPAAMFFCLRLNLERFTNPVYLFNIVYLGIGASAACFVTWNFAVKILGAVRTSIFIYMIPVITVTTSVIVLNEKITKLSAAGITLTMVGLFLSQSKIGDKSEREII